MSDRTITFVSHTNKPGGGELALRRYLQATELPVRLVTLEAGGVWEGLRTEVIHVTGPAALRRSLRRGGLVVANSMRAAFLTSLVAPRSISLVYWVRDGLTQSAMSRLALTLTKQVTARRAFHYLANSQWTADTIKRALKVMPGRIDVVYSMCGVTEETLDRPHRRQPRSVLRLLFLGRLAPWKAPDVAVRSLNTLRKLGIDATLTIAGASHFDEDDYVKKLEQLIESEPAARIVGHVSQIDDLLNSHDVLIHCSTVPEPFGQVLVQGMAAGIPVIATRNGGPEELLGDAPVDVLYSPGNPIALARAIANAQRHYAVLSRCGLERASAFTDETAAGRTDVVLRALLARSAGARLSKPN